MLVATWNINSVRMRVNLVSRFLRGVLPDVLCLQETKVRDELFPRQVFERLGYVEQAFTGQKSYNGVAILSRLPLSKVRIQNWCNRKDCRHIYAQLPGNIELHNIYVPAGGEIPDPKRDPKFAHKLRFLDELTRWFRRRRQRMPRAIVAGDLNVAPLETDVWSHEKLKRVVTHTPVEVEALARLQASNDWIDAIRYFVPKEKKLYTWWSYRATDWKRVNKGRRLDHIWVSKGLSRRLKSADVLKKVRGWKRASDHVPALIQLT